MKINKWYLKNFKSIGDVQQEIQLNQDKGELILLIGRNGAGKSTILEGLDFALFGEVQNKSGKRVINKNFPNRINGNLKAGVEFFVNDIPNKIERKMQNSSSSIDTTLIENDIPYKKAGKIDKRVEELVGFDYKTYKSFISMNVNNFKNFISLTPEDKRMLLDKLFSLDEINELNKILKELNKQNEKNHISLSNSISVYDENITNLQNTINEVIQKNKDKDKEQLANLKLMLEQHKPTFENLENVRQELDNDINEFNTGIRKFEIKLNDISRDIRQQQEKIDLYKSGKCPTCGHDLSEDIDILNDLTLQYEKSNEVKNKIKTKLDKAKEELIKMQTNKRNADIQYNNMYTTLSDIKISIQQLKNKKEDNLEEFQTTLNNTILKKEEKEKEYVEIKKLKLAYDLLLPIWGENGVKRDIIESIIDPINAFIQEDLNFFKMRFKVHLDNNFDAHIMEWNNEIDPETLSTGEAKKINIIIMMAYIKMLRMKNEINILFLDEVFASIDLEGIDDILVMFKKFANDRNINLFLVHHAELKDWFFDKIYSIKNTTFTYIEEKIID